MRDRTRLVARWVLGLMFLFFGSNDLFHIMDLPLGNSEKFNDLMVALMHTGYFFPILKSLEIIVGLSLLFNAWVPLALIILAPISVNILLVHVFLDQMRLPLSLLIILLQSYLIFEYWGAWKVLIERQYKSIRPATD